MSTDYGLGLVVGKFAPLHEGHVLVVQRAASLCKQIAIISYSNPELPGYRAELREAWLKASFPAALLLVVTPERLGSWLSGADVPAIPANDAPDCDHREFVALICRRILRRPVEAVFTSEAYGDGFAAHLTESFRATRFSSRTVRHIMVDRERRTVSISGTELRHSLWRHWNYLPALVARTLVRRIVFLGGESSGKTVLASRLAGELSTEWAPEYGRELWEVKGGNLSYEDLSIIAREQVRREESAAHRARAFIFCDTSPLTTLFYSLDIFGDADAELRLAANRQYDAVVLCAPDFPFVQDGTRRSDAFRQRQHLWYEAQLAARGIPYVIARGPLQDRIQFVRQSVGL